MVTIMVTINEPLMVDGDLVTIMAKCYCAYLGRANVIQDEKMRDDFTQRKIFLR